MTVQRICKCGCNRLFTPPASRPGHEYIHGHKPRTGKALVKPAAPPKAEERKLDFRIALKTAREEMVRLAQLMDELDNQIVPVQQQLRALEAEKDKICGRHLMLSTTAEALEAVIEGRDLRTELAEGGTE